MSDFKDNIIYVDFIKKDLADSSSGRKDSPVLRQAGESQHDHNLRLLWSMLGTQEYKDLMKVRRAPLLQKRADLVMRKKEIGELIRYIQSINPKSWSTSIRADLLQAAFKILKEKLSD